MPANVPCRSVAVLRLSPHQERLLQALTTIGDSVHFQLLTRAVYGRRRDDLSPIELGTLNRSVLHLERRGLLAVARQWGTMGYGQPGLIRLTTTGQMRAAAGAVSSPPSPPSHPS